MLLLAADFSNLHEILKNLYVEMMPLCSNMAGVAKGIAGLGDDLRRLPCVAVPRESRTHRCVPDATTVRHRYLYHVLPDDCARYDKQHIKPHCTGNARYVGNPDNGYEQVPGDERQVGV